MNGSCLGLKGLSTAGILFSTKKKKRQLVVAPCVNQVWPCLDVRVELGKISWLDLSVVATCQSHSSHAKAQSSLKATENHSNEMFAWIELVRKAVSDLKIIFYFLVKPQITMCWIWNRLWLEMKIETGCKNNNNSRGVAGLSICFSLFWGTEETLRMLAERGQNSTPQSSSQSRVHRSQRSSMICTTSLHCITISNITAEDPQSSRIQV